MIQEWPLLFTLLSGLTTPLIEQSLSLLDNRSFFTRAKATDYLVVNGEPYFLRIFLEGCSSGMGIEKTVRIQNVSDRVIFSLSSKVEEWYLFQWATEGEMAEAILGNNWPCMYSLTYRDPRFLDRRGFDKLLNQYYYFNTVDHTTSLKREFYCFELTSRQRLVGRHADNWGTACTKMWMIDELKKGTHPLVLSIVLHDMRACEKSRKMGLDYDDFLWRNIDRFKIDRRESIKVLPMMIQRFEGN